MKKALILEGGGKRGAYTAGALAWLVDHNIEFNNSYSISVGSIHLLNYLRKNKKDLHDYSIYHIANKKIMGLSSILRCFRLVDYDYMFEKYLPEVAGLDIDGLKELKVDGKYGLYECEQGLTVYKSIKDSCLKELQASCTLPIIGKTVEINPNRHILDGGITEMIPIKESIKDGNDIHLVITTKPKDYIRKKANPLVVKLMKIVYPKWQSIANDYSIRHLNYVDQINRITTLESDNKVVYICPSRHTNVTRLSGSIADLEDLYNLGYSDMEDNKEVILKMFK